ncbi:MAG: type II secretion system minor pseudopilin GspI [Proteobacteria bacterium]|nr:type II secretion system minor pseudopilin GspI [Pseudomonadota bacterium]MBU1686371.1 type II secretion system minor pseudopilin GspI [Pseudomonadota bacterium]
MEPRQQPPMVYPPHKYPSGAKSTSRGFTLLELLVALAILSIVAISALKNNSTIIANTTYLQDKTMAHWVAMNKAAELQLAGNWLPEEEEIEGVAVLADRQWQWHAKGQATPDPDLQQLEIRVGPFREQGKFSPMADVTVYLGRPTGYTL